MKIVKINLKFVLITSLIGCIISGTFIGILISLNSSWKYNLTSNFEEQISDTSISNNGEYIVVGSGNDKLYLFWKFSSNPLWIFRSTGDIVSVDISSDSNFIVAGGEDGTANLFTRISSTPIWTLSTGNYITSAAISSDGSYSAFCSGKHLYVYQRSSNSLIIDRSNSGDQVAISSNGDYFSSIDNTNGIILFFSKESSTPIWQYNTGAYLFDVAMTPNGDYIVTSGQTLEIFLFNRSSSTPKIMLTDSSVRNIVISQDGKYIAAGCVDGIYLFETLNLTRLWKYTFPYIYSDNFAISISSSGANIVANHWRDPLDGLLFFNKLSSTPILTFETKANSRVNEIDISSDGNHISVVTQQNAYYLNLRNPIIDDFFQLKVYISIVALGGFLSLGLVYSIIDRIKKAKIEKEVKEKQILETLETLDKKYQDWGDKENEENKI